MQINTCALIGKASQTTLKVSVESKCCYCFGRAPWIKNVRFHGKTRAKDRACLEELRKADKRCSQCNGYRELPFMMSHIFPTLIILEGYLVMNKWWVWFIFYQQILCMHSKMVVSFFRFSFWFVGFPNAVVMVMVMVVLPYLSCLVFFPSHPYGVLLYMTLPCLLLHYIVLHFITLL